VSRLVIDHEALAGGFLALTKAAGLLPDATPFDIPESDPAPSPKPLEQSWRPQAEKLDIFLAVPEHRPGGHNVSTPGNESGTRYTAEVVVNRDENTGRSEKPFQVARRNLRLVSEGESLKASSAIRLARVLKGPTGSFELDPSFVPPLLDITASDHLMGIARRLVAMLSSKSSDLSGSRRQRGLGLADFGVADIANFWLLYTVNEHLPGFRHLFETRRGHPGELFNAMLTLAGSLTTFSTRVHPRDLPTYDHSDLSGCFGRLDTVLRDLLETVVPANHVALPLRITQPSIHAVAIDQDRYFAGPQIYLAIRAAMKQDQLLLKVPQLMKVSSADQIEQLIRRALPGVDLRHVPDPPSAVPVKLDYHYFRLEREGAGWDAIRRARNLAVWVPSDFPEPQLELVVILPPTA
jgi:type VI secretion system protein ImpJ